MPKNKDPESGGGLQPKEETTPVVADPPETDPQAGETPVKEEPVKDEPVKEDPAKEEPVEEESPKDEVEDDPDAGDGDPAEDDPDDEDESGEGTRPTAEDLAGRGTSQVKGKDLGAADGTIEMLLEMAERLPQHAVTYGVEMYAQLTPYANLRNSPLDESDFSRDYIDQIYSDLVPVYNRAKFILNCANYAASTQSSAGNQRLFVSPTGKSLTQIKTEMLDIMRKIVEIDSQLCANANAKIAPEDMPAMPALEDLPARLWSGSQEKLTPPLGFDFVPVALVDRAMEAYSHFVDLKIDEQYREFQNLCVTYCKKVHQDIRETFIEVVGFIKDLVAGFKEMAADPAMWEDVLEALREDLANKKSALAYRLQSRASEFSRIEEKARAIPRLRRLADSATGDQRFESAAQALEFFSGTAGLNYELRGGVGDSGGLTAFWNFMEPSLQKFEKTVKLLPPTAKLSDYFIFDSAKWDLVRKSYETAGAKWRELSAGA